MGTPKLGFLSFFFFCFLGLYSWHVEVPRSGAALKTDLEDLGEANRREETTNLLASLVLESISLERCLCHQEGP